MENVVFVKLLSVFAAVLIHATGSDRMVLVSDV
jgi:hypothetical protein